MAAAMTALTACSDDDDDFSNKLPLSSPVIEAGTPTYNTLSFSWQPVSGAVQYGYELIADISGEAVATDVTTLTSATFTNLEPGTAYTLRLRAFAAYESNNATSAIIEMHQSTAALIGLDAPELTVTHTATHHQADWTAVDGADAYAYTLTNTTTGALREGTTTDTTLNLTCLFGGDYTLTVRATSADPAHQSASDATSDTFSVDGSLLWTVSGTYTGKCVRGTWAATMSHFADGSYCIYGWHGVEGYDLHFFVDPDNAADMVALPEELYTLNSNYYFEVPTGLDSTPIVQVYPWNNYSRFSGDETSGQITLTTTARAADTFAW
jgi:hypothetical protein